MSKKTHYMHRLYLPTVMFAIGLFLSACGSSSSGPPAQNNQPNDWDSMNWDQGSWN